jgi:methylglutaconyl-CoA hydratase
MSASPSEGYVRSQIREGVHEITFFHPAHNAMPGYQLKALADAIDQAGHSQGSAVIVLQSEGDRTFCAGASFDELASISDEDQGKAFFMGFANVINACRRSPKLIIGRVQGKAVGGGVGLAAATDVCFAVERASLRLSELVVGIGPFVVGPAIERKVGTSAFGDLALHPADWFTAAWALEKGLYFKVCPDIASMDAAIADYTRELMSYHPEALREMKKVLWQGAADWDTLLADRAAISGRLVLSDFTRHAIQSFKAARADA